MTYSHSTFSPFARRQSLNHKGCWGRHSFCERSTQPACALLAAGSWKGRSVILNTVHSGSPYPFAERTPPSANLFPARFPTLVLDLTCKKHFLNGPVRMNFSLSPGPIAWISIILFFRVWLVLEEITFGFFFHQSKGTKPGVIICSLTWYTAWSFT